MTGVLWRHTDIKPKTGMPGYDCGILLATFSWQFHFESQRILSLCTTLEEQNISAVNSYCTLNKSIHFRQNTHGSDNLSEAQIQGFHNGEVDNMCIFGPNGGGWTNVHKEELYYSYSPTNIIRVINSEWMRWPGNGEDEKGIHNLGPKTCLGLYLWSEAQALTVSTTYTYHLETDVYHLISPYVKATRIPCRCYCLLPWTGILFQTPRPSNTEWEIVTILTKRMRTCNHYCTALYCTVWYAGWKAYLSAFLTAALQRWVAIWCRFNPGEKAPDIHTWSDLADLKADVSAVTKTQIPFPAGNRTPASP
jgi:hypothetical protein